LIVFRKISASSAWLYSCSDRNHLAGAPLAQPHQRFVHRNPHQPRIKLGVALELVELLVRLQEGVLHDVLSILAVLRDVLRNAKDLPVVLLYQRLEGVYIAAPGTLDERYVRMHLFGCAHWFDGRTLGRFQRIDAFR
jgi:hypothetical protein